MAFSAAVGNVISNIVKGDKEKDKDKEDAEEGVVVENPQDADDENDFDHIMSVLAKMKDTNNSGKSRKERSRDRKQKENFSLIDYSKAKVVQTGSAVYENDFHMQGRRPETASKSRGSGDVTTGDVTDKTSRDDDDRSRRGSRDKQRSAQRSGSARGSSGSKSRGRSGSSGEDDGKGGRRRRRRRRSRGDSAVKTWTPKGCNCKHDFLPVVGTQDKETMTEICGNPDLKGWVCFGVETVEHVEVLLSLSLSMGHQPSHTLDHRSQFFRPFFILNRSLVKVLR